MGILSCLRKEHRWWFIVLSALMEQSFGGGQSIQLNRGERDNESRSPQICFIHPDIFQLM